MSEIVNLLTMIFVAASVSLAVLNRFSHPAIPAYILAGLAISPWVPEDSLLSLSQLGIVFLVFIFGIKFDPSRLKTVAKESRLSAVIQIVAVGGLAYGLAYLLGLSPVESIYFGLFSAISSSLVGLRLIDREVQIDLVHGRLAESIHLVQDLIALTAIVILTSPSTTLQGIGADLGTAVLLLGVGFFFRIFLFKSLAELVGDSQELLMISSLAVLSAFIGLTQLVQLNMVIGAFSAGIAFAKFPENMEILDTTGSLKDFFSAIFFISLGTLVSIPGIQTLILASTLIILTVFVKPAVTALSLQLQGFDDRTAYLTGFSLDQISEFSLILAITSYLAGEISFQLFESLIIAAAVTMITSAYTTRHEEAMYSLMSRLDFMPSLRQIQGSTDLSGHSGHVILIGYDIQGRDIARKLSEEGQQFVVIENDPEKIEEMKEEGIDYVYGDVMHLKPWNIAKAAEAELIISTVPVKKVSERILRVETSADKILRAEELEDAKLLLEKGATYVNVPDIAGSEMLLDHLKGILQNPNYREELRRKNLLRLRKQQQ